MTNTTHNQIKKQLRDLASYTLEHAGEYREYSDEELVNAMLIFQEVFMAKMYDHNIKNKLDFDQRAELAKEAGKSLHQTVLLFTGVDLRKVIK